MPLNLILSENKRDVAILSKEANTKMNEVETKIAQSAATFLGSQMEI